MNTQGVISINPTCQPQALNVAKEILGNSKIASRPVNAVKGTARLILGISKNTKLSRRQWSFRVVLGSILMIFGLLFLQTSVFDASERVLPGISIAMIAGGAMIACGLLTRIVSFALAVIITMTLFHFGVVYMTGFSLLVCLGACIASLITGSGRFSLDTLVYNGLFSSSRCNKSYAL